MRGELIDNEAVLVFPISQFKFKIVSPSQSRDSQIASLPRKYQPIS